MFIKKLKKPKIAFVITSVYMLNFFLIPHFKVLSKFYDITLLLKNDAPEILKKIQIPVKIIEIPIERKISLIKDIKALFFILMICYKNKFIALHTLTPKAGLLGMLAAFFIRIPYRIHTFQGEVWSNKNGIKKLFFKNIDRLIVLCSTHLLVVSNSEKLFLIDEKILLNKKSSVLGAGSIGGVDCKKFICNPSLRKVLRKKHNFSKENIVYMYLGRICEDKGLITLGKAFINLYKKNSNVKLIIVGPNEDDTYIKLKLLFNNIPENSIIFKSYTDKPEKELLLADIFVLPSYREGFGVAILEAAALGIPSIGSNIHGIQDAIVDKKTGYLFNVGDEIDLLSKMEKFINVPNYKKIMGLKAKQRTQKQFEQKMILREFINYYHNLLFK